MKKCHVATCGHYALDTDTYCPKDGTLLVPVPICQCGANSLPFQTYCPACGARNTVTWQTEPDPAAETLLPPVAGEGIKTS